MRLELATAFPLEFCCVNRYLPPLVGLRKAAEGYRGSVAGRAEASASHALLVRRKEWTRGANDPRVKNKLKGS
jgi:hypothetical protein